MIPRSHLIAMLLAFSTAAVLLAQTPAPVLPPPYQTPSITKFPKVIGWPKDRLPTAPPGFTVTAFARDIENPRWIYVLPNGDVLVAQSRTLPKKQTKPEVKEGQKESKTVTGTSPNVITLLRDANGDGVPDVRETFLAGLNQPLGMALVKEILFVGNTDALVAYPYKTGETKIDAKGMKIIDLPGGGYNNHWTRNVLSNADGSKLYVTVGSGSNVAEHGTANEVLRANILEMNLDGTAFRVFASGLRNPVGLAWEPNTKLLWTAVNERDELGDELVPDYLTSVKEGGFYGWPYSYFGQNEDPRRKGERPDLVKKTIIPDVALDSHSASLGLAFATGSAMPTKYRQGAFIGQRGSWNRSKFAGYRVAFVPFREGKPIGPPEDFLSGFIANDDEVYGRPVGVAFAADGALLVADEPGNIVWRVAPTPRGGK